ncbi:hypothetical protein WH47_12589, partial [Habropoda laboriosa]
VCVGSVTSSDSGHSTQLDSHSGSSVEAGGSPPPPQRRHSAMQGTTGLGVGVGLGVQAALPPPGAGTTIMTTMTTMTTMTSMTTRPGIGGTQCRQPPAYKVAAQMARLHRLGRAHSHEGVTYRNDHEDGTKSKHNRYLQIQSTTLLPRFSLDVLLLLHILFFFRI